MVLTKSQAASVIYHDIFEYPLTQEELKKWRVGKIISNYQLATSNYQIKNGFYFLKGKEINIKKRLQRQKYSEKKLKIAREASKVLSHIPSILMVAVTGALAMKNAEKESDIDLMIVTRKGTLWLTRALVFLIIKVLRIPLRKPRDKYEKDRLCLNLWLDEADLTWLKEDRNIYTAHEIGQIIPLVNKNFTYEKFINKNKWIFDYWPNAVRIMNYELRSKYERKYKSPLFIILNSLFSLVEPLARNLQYWYMKEKMTREVVTPTRAIFHPNDQGLEVIKKLNKYGIF